MPAVTIGVQTLSLRLPLRRALAAAAELGADGVEIDLRTEVRAADLSQTALRELRKVLDDLGLRVVSASFPTRRGFDDPDDLDRRLQATCEAMTLAYKLGARVVVGRAAATSAAIDPGPTLVQALGLLGTHSERAGARFAFASGAPPAEQQALLDALPDGAVGVALQPALLLAGDQEPADVAARLGRHVLTVAGVDAVRDPSVAGARATETPLGRGEADFPELLGSLDEHGFSGPVVVQRADAADPLAELRDAVAYLRALAG